MGGSIELEQGVVVLTVPVRVDVSNTREIIAPVRQEILAGHRAIVLDLRRTQAIDSTALGALVQIFKSVSAQGGKLILADVGDAVRRILSMTRLDTVFTLSSSRADAVMQLRRFV